MKAPSLSVKAAFEDLSHNKYFYCAGAPQNHSLNPCNDPVKMDYHCLYFSDKKTEVTWSRSKSLVLGKDSDHFVYVSITAVPTGADALPAELGVGEESLLSPWRLLATKAGSGEELGACELGNVLSFPLSLFAPSVFPLGGRGG